MSKVSSVTIKDLRFLVQTLHEALEREGITTELRLDEGSKLNGRAFRLYFTDGASAIGTSNGFLGWTKREAYETLWTIIRTIEDVWYLQDLRKEDQA